MAPELKWLQRRFVGFGIEFHSAFCRRVDRGIEAYGSSWDPGHEVNLKQIGSSMHGKIIIQYLYSTSSCVLCCFPLLAPLYKTILALTGSWGPPVAVVVVFS